MEFLWVVIGQNTHVFSTYNLIHKEIKVINYNVFFKNKDKIAITSKIISEDPDIVVLQEVTESWGIHLLNSLGSKYKYNAINSMVGTHGCAVFSKFPISNIKYLNNNSGAPFAQLMDVQVENVKVKLANVHLASPAIAVENPDRFIPLILNNYTERKEQYEALNEHFNISQRHECKLIVGDLNTTSYEPLYNQIRRNWRDANNYPKLNFDANFPNSRKLPFPLFKLDYILGNGNVKMINEKVIKGGSSDHQGIVAILEI
jgi:endonuclease/exonuclease/phosphatase family metal-dependent hydrolase